MDDPTSNDLLLSHYDPETTPTELFAWHRAYGTQFPARPAPRWRRDAKIRVGYVSADFYGHAVANFLRPIVRAHDRSRVDVFLYANNDVSDFVTAEFQTLGTWRPIRGVSDEVVAAQIAEDKIDVLVDCTGHMAGKRMTLFARRPAPVSVTFLGYPDTTGLTQIDYRLTDAICDPPEEGNAFATETLIRMPNGIHTYAPLTDVDALVSHDPPVVKNGFITFGSFNKREKINDHVIRLWADVLNAVPNSRLLLKDGGWRGNPFFGRVDNGRVQVMPRMPSYLDHHGAYAAVDVALDPFPYCGTTTTCDALWMGVPVITLQGDRHSARTSASLLTRVGLAGLIAKSREDYVGLAKTLAADVKSLATLRQTMRQRITASPLGDAVTVTRDLEAFYDRVTAPR